MLNKEQNGKKYFKLYNVFANTFERKFRKRPCADGEEEEKGGAIEESDSFEVDPSASFLVYA